jgi:hypothetical protein
MALLSYNSSNHKAVYVSPASGVSVVIVGKPDNVEAVLKLLEKAQK